jgi:hypothetical protein
VDSLAENSAETPLPAESTVIGRVSVLGVAFAGAVALGSASAVSSDWAGGLALLAALVAVVGGGVWWYRPRIGYWILLVDGLLTMAVSGVALARGALPWLLVAFWGGSALLLAAILHLTADAGRSGTVTLVAVISLLVLSALGLGQYVRTTWTPSERLILERLPKLVGMPVSAWADPIEPVADGAWGCTWVTPAAPAEAMRRIGAALTRNGWRVDSTSAYELSAEKAGEHLDVSVDEAWEAAGPAKASEGETRVFALAYHGEARSAP